MRANFLPLPRDTTYSKNLQQSPNATASLGDRPVGVSPRSNPSGSHPASYESSPWFSSPPTNKKTLLKFPILDSRGLLFHVSTLAPGSPRLALQEPSTRRPETTSKAKLAACAAGKLEPTTAQPHTPSSPITKPASQPPHVPSSHQETRQAPPERGSAKAKLRSTSWEFLGCLPVSLGANASRPAALAPPLAAAAGSRETSEWRYVGLHLTLGWLGDVSAVRR